MHQIISWGQSSCRITFQTTIAFYSRKLNIAQEWYTTIEREFSSSIETCKEYKNILIVFTDHKNNNFNSLKGNSSDRVLRWLLLLEEYGVTFEYLPGKKNVGAVANTLSRLDIDILNIQEEA
jgi:hypothetical protein